MMVIPGATPLLAAICFLLGQAARVWDAESPQHPDEEWSEEEELVMPRFPCEHFPVGVVKCNETAGPRILGAGSYGTTWLAEDASSASQVVIKLFFGEDSDPGKPDAYLTAAQKDKLAELRVLNECFPAQRVHERGPNGKVHPGAQRVRRCLGDNFGTATGEEMLYVVLEDAGSMPLNEYLSKSIVSGTWTTMLARKAIKQILQGVEALASIGWVHHDLSPRNVMVREAGGDILLQVIDLGCSMPGKKENRCDFDAGYDGVYAPPEAAKAEVCKVKRDDGTLSMFGAAFDAEAPLAYDAYSAAQIVVELLFTLNPQNFFALAPYKKQAANVVLDSWSKKPLKLEWVADALSDSRRSKDLETFATELDEDWYPKKEGEPKEPPFDHRKNLRALSEPAAVEFLRAIEELLNPDPKERASASRLLGTRWMRETAVAENPGA